MDVKYSEWHRGWLAFVSGYALKDKRRQAKVFPTKLQAEAALRKALCRQSYRTR